MQQLPSRLTCWSDHNVSVEYFLLLNNLETFFKKIFLKENLFYIKQVLYVLKNVKDNFSGRSDSATVFQFSFRDSSLKIKIQVVVYGVMALFELFWVGGCLWCCQAILENLRLCFILSNSIFARSKNFELCPKKFKWYPKFHFARAKSQIVRLSAINIYLGDPARFERITPLR